jgi:hypothetical protein
MDPTNRLQLEMQLREARKAEIEKRVKAHKLQVDRIERGNRLRSVHGLGPRKVPLDFLAIGDSWFEYPLNDDGLLGPNAAVVADTQLQSMGSPPPVILSYALHGQASTAVLSWENQDSILKALTDPSTTHWNNGTTADGILVSAGGNDVVGDQFAIYLDYGGGGLDKARFQGVLASVQASYMDLFALRDIVTQEVKVDPKNIPIFGHCYDYAIPNGRPAGWPIPLAGPWLQPPLEFSGYDYSQGLKIVKDAIDGFHDMLYALATDKITLPGKTTNNFMLINTTGTITRDTTRPSGWANEIHPYTEGFTALANKWLSGLRKHFPGRI